MQHDVAITKTRTILMDGPLIFNIDKSIQGGRPFDFDLRWARSRCFGGPQDAFFVGERQPVSPACHSQWAPQEGLPLVDLCIRLSHTHRGLVWFVEGAKKLLPTHSVETHARDYTCANHTQQPSVWLCCESCLSERRGTTGSNPNPKVQTPIPPRKPCRFGVMDRHAEDATSIEWMETDACYNYHVMNAWDDPEHPQRVILVTCRSAMTGALGMADIRTTQFDGDQQVGVLKECVEEATLHRFVLDTEVHTRLIDVLS